LRRRSQACIMPPSLLRVRVRGARLGFGLRHCWIAVQPRAQVPCHIRIGRWEFRMRLLLRFCAFCSRPGPSCSCFHWRGRRSALAFPKDSDYSQLQDYEPPVMTPVHAGTDAGCRIRHQPPALNSDPGRAEDGDQRLPRREDKTSTSTTASTWRIIRAGCLCADLWDRAARAGERSFRLLPSGLIAAFTQSSSARYAAFADARYRSAVSTIVVRFGACRQRRVNARSRAIEPRRSDLRSTDRRRHIGAEPTNE